MSIQDMHGESQLSRGFEFLARITKYFPILVITVILSLPVTLAFGQEEQPKGPVYIVQEGDSLLDIAQRFGVSMDDLSSINGITNPNLLSVGVELIIPGLDGIQGFLTTRSIPYGETLRSLSRRYRVPPELLARLNHLASPAELYAGYTLLIPDQTGVPSSYGRVMLTTGQSLLELAVLQNTDPWTLIMANDLAGSGSALPGDVLLFSDETDGPGALPGAVTALEITPLPLLQGKTTVISVSTPKDIMIRGSFMGQTIAFFRSSDSSYSALIGVHAMAQPGVYPLALSGTMDDGTTFKISQGVNVRGINYPYDRPLTVDPATIDPAVTRPENAQWAALAAPTTPERLWDILFQIPSPLPVDYCLETNECWSSRFGNRRSYNGSPYTYFHTGLDIYGGTGTEIYAPAPGLVVFADPLTVRGNATMIDHGWGVYTGYMHQSEVRVQVGDHVEAGQVIGLVGGSGRAEGPHLHWEVWVGGVQVEPLDWLKQIYP